MKVHLYERAFLWLGAVMLVAFLVALGYAGFQMGIHLPGRAGTVDPRTVASQPPFDSPGVRQLGPGRYEVVMIGRAWTFQPGELRFPTGSHVTFLATSTDVIHGLHVEGTRVNLMLIPGQVARNSYRFEEPGEHLMVCHEFCGVGHHMMSGRVVVGPATGGGTE